jgi:uncharacterized membrane protein
MRAGVRAGLVVAVVLGAASPVSPQGGPPPGGRSPNAEATDLVNGLLGALMGGGDVTGQRLQEEVAEAGELPFRAEVPVAFIGNDKLAAYLRDLLDEDYPETQARVDERLLVAFDLLPEGTGLRSLRARVLQDNVAGFYDDRPGVKRLYAVSDDSSFTPMNQIVLAHELRHAQQDQYEDLHARLSDDVGDFDDRRVAWVSLLEGDATLVMERFLRLRLGVLGEGRDETAGDDDALALAGTGALDLPGAPPVVRDHLIQPYLAGLRLARAIWARGGGAAMREAWHAPPESTEQVLHPEKYFAREAPRWTPPRLVPPEGARLLSEGVLGELLLRTLVDGDEEAAAGWGGDGWRLWDVGARTVLAWRSEWDRTEDAREFHRALAARFARHRGGSEVRRGWEVYAAPGRWRFALRLEGDAVELLSSDDGALLRELTAWEGGPAAGSGARALDTRGGADARVPAADPDLVVVRSGPAKGGEMATSAPQGGESTNLGMKPNLAGLLCYVPCCIGLVFSVVAAIVEKQSRFVRFHAFQSLLIHAIAIVLGIGLNVAQVALGMSGLGALGLLLSLLAMVVGVAFLGVTVFLMIKANAGEEFELPVIGPMARQWV